MEVNDIAGLTEPLKRLIEVISTGVGNVFKPYLIRKTADAKAYEIKVISEAMAESKKQLAITRYDDGKVELLMGEVTPAGYPELPSRVYARTQYQEHRKQQNVEAVCANAAEDLKNDTAVPREWPEPEWVARFFETSSVITSEELQYLWGRILAGEIRRPGTFSMRTLDVLRNLSKREAENFAKLGNYILRSGEKAFYVDPGAAISNKVGGLSFLEILALKDAGLIFPNELEFSFNPGRVNETSHLLYGPLVLIFERAQETPKLGSSVGFLTRVGMELLHLLAVSPDMEYVKFVGKRFSANGVAFAWAPITAINGDQIHFGNKTYA